ncbi:hypothetical protein Pla100_58380 [Neorhodopirellula pilleata]|uniref:Uncharacterized protein n=1 Tax=Neorhodopirellula pilleata TaxID=2714738 RepID=A0A5C5ZKE5_9BACT|nr:hypothetical protein Pla100_58380 [Neorhodopirellula pilleata]
MATKKTTTATKTAPAKNASAKKPAAKKQPAPKTAKATTPKKPAATKTTDKKMSQIDAALAVLKKARKPLSCKEMVEAMRLLPDLLYQRVAAPALFQRLTCVPDPRGKMLDFLHQDDVVRPA